MLPRTEKLPEINNLSFLKAREAKCLSHKDVATALCLSPKHIEQLENNESSIFFSLKHRNQVAKKVAEFLNISISDAFIYYEEAVCESNSKVDIDSEYIERIQEPNKKSVDEVGKKVIAISKKYLLDRKKQFSKVLIGSLAVFFTTFIFVYSFKHIDQLSELVTNQTTIIKSKNADEVVVSNQNAQLIPMTTRNACDFDRNTLLRQTVANPSKSGNYIYIVGKSKTVICIIDSQNNTNEIELDQGMPKSIFGKAPFIVVSKNFSGFDIFYQGSKILTPSAEIGGIELIEVSLNIPRE